jgi:hypothetical protein
LRLLIASPQMPDGRHAAVSRARRSLASKSFTSVRASSGVSPGSD